MKTEMYFIRVITMQLPKNNLQKQIDQELASFNHYILHNVEGFVETVRNTVLRLNKENPRCHPATVSYTNTKVITESPSHLLFVSCREWSVNIPLMLVNGVYEE